MKILSLNCHAWQEENQIEKLKHLAEVIKENDYDVIALQEVNQSITADSVDDNIKDDNFALCLNKELQNIKGDKYDFFWDFSHIGYDKYEEGLAIMTKHKIVNAESFFITKNHDTTYWKTRKIVKATIEIDNEEIDFYSCHLGWWLDEEEPFKYQIDSLMNKVDLERKSFLMGDFNNNAFIRDEGYDYLINKGLTDLFLSYDNHDKGITVKGKIDGWDKNTEDLRLDLILCNIPMKVKSANVIFNGINKEIVSDHFGVEVEL